MNEKYLMEKQKSNVPRLRRCPMKKKPKRKAPTILKQGIPVENPMRCARTRTTIEAPQGRALGRQLPCEKWLKFKAHHRGRMSR